MSLTLFRMGGGKNPLSPTNFSSVTSTNVGISPEIFLTFSLNPFFTLVSIFKAIPRASPKLLNLNQDHPTKKCLFWPNLYKIEVMRISFIEMLPDFGHMTTLTIWFN